MSRKITTAAGYAVPPASQHSVTVHMPTWEKAEEFGTDSSKIIANLHNAYPRMKPHRDIASLSTAVLRLIGAENEACFLFSTLQSATECVEYATSSKRDNGADKSPVPVDQIQIRPFSAKDPFFAVVFPSDKYHVLRGFWTTPGAAVSSRFAEANLEWIDQLTEVPVVEDEKSRPKFEGLPHKVLRERIVYYLERAPLDPTRQPRPTTEDVYFFPTGMASIYKPHSYMLKHYHGTTILFGMAFMHTLNTFQEFGPGYKFFGLGSDEDLCELERYLEEERSYGRKVQAIWAEFPANPILVCPNITKLRELADKYDVVLAIDDTIGSWANIDITHMADMLVTSLTKSFNGYADLIAGSAVLNPASHKYRELKSLFDKYYVPELYIDDAEALERNSRDYLTRTAKLNHNANSLVQYLQSCAEDPNSAIFQVHYPTVNPSGKHFKQFMRPSTEEFTPGYGCLFTVESEDLATTATFYDNLNVHNSVHLGAPFTLAIAYTMCTYKKQLDWAARYGLRPTQIRISAGLENTDELLEDFRIAVEASNRAKIARQGDVIEYNKAEQ
ncbi:PLP-dependent transferase [Daldinia caldariorum]|uniref:PLP-dependent transferase n=1 Tax=Daldinia caldariorum TaxID=326644 RepID=UPI00200888B6|nr:PLP-dependent transferase [Daldinia caldariorum]KAI1464542.1 PLP-dependent transferase [Daldinia caldariorum]